MAEDYDVAVIGCTAAGLVAAISLARAGRNVAVVDAPAMQTTESPLADWVPRDLFEQAPFLKSLPKAAAAEAFHSVHFYNADASRDARLRLPRVAGYTVAPGKLIAALQAVARKAKVHFVTEPRWPGLRLQEHRVLLTGLHDMAARLLLIAQDSPSHVINELSLPVRSVPHGAMAVLGLDVTWTAAKVAKHLEPGLRVIDMQTQGRMGLVFPVASTVHVRVIGQGEPPSATDLSDLVHMLQRSGLLPADMPLTRVRGAMWYPPAGVALDLETHVAKRTLLIGTAGGFAGMMTGQTTAPSVRSALLAAKVAERALDAKEPQGALGVFKNEWRRALADYLRPPSTSLHLLLPLLFVNKQMVGRIAGAMLYGQSL